jgi:hypothetical protein
MISAAHFSASVIALTVAGTLFTPSLSELASSEDACCNQQRAFAAFVHPEEFLTVSLLFATAGKAFTSVFRPVIPARDWRVFRVLRGI